MRKKKAMHIDEYKYVSNLPGDGNHDTAQFKHWQRLKKK